MENLFEAKAEDNNYSTVRTTSEFDINTKGSILATGVLTERLSELLYM